MIKNTCRRTGVFLCFKDQKNAKNFIYNNLLLYMKSCKIIAFKIG